MPQFTFDDFARITDNAKRIQPKVNPKVSISVNKDGNLCFNDQAFPDSIGATGMMLVSNGVGIEWSDSPLAGITGIGSQGVTGIQGVTGVGISSESCPELSIPYSSNNSFIGSPLKTDGRSISFNTSEGLNLGDQDPSSDYSFITFGNDDHANATITSFRSRSDHSLDHVCISIHGGPRTIANITQYWPLSEYPIDIPPCDYYFGANGFYTYGFRVYRQPNVGSPTTYVEIESLREVYGSPTSPAPVYVNSTGKLQRGSSDIRLKDNILPMKNCLEVLIQLKPVKFTWKENNAPSFGFIAQEVQKVYPELVSTANDERGTLSLDYSKLVAPLVGALKELKAEIDLMKQQIEALKACQ